MVVEDRMSSDIEKLKNTLRAAAAEEHAAQDARAALERIAPTPTDPETGEPLIDEQWAILSIKDWDWAKRGAEAAYEAGDEKVRQHLRPVLAALRRAEMVAP